MLLSHSLKEAVTKTVPSRRFGLRRRTIHECVETGGRDLEGRGTRYKARQPVGHKLDPYQGIIETRPNEVHRFSAKGLYEEVRAAGCTGGHFCVTDYVRSVRPQGPVQWVVRFEAPAGWSHADHRPLVSHR